MTSVNVGVGSGSLERSYSLPPARRKHRRVNETVEVPTSIDNNCSTADMPSLKQKFWTKPKKVISGQKSNIRVSKFNPLCVDLSPDVVEKMKGASINDVTSGKHLSECVCCKEQMKKMISPSSTPNGFMRRIHGSIRKRSDSSSNGLSSMLKTAELSLLDGESLGITIKKRKLNKKQESLLASLKGSSITCKDAVFVSKIRTDSSASRSGQICVGDQIVCVNGVDVTVLCVKKVAAMMVMMKKHLLLTLRTFYRNITSSNNDNCTCSEHVIKPHVMQTLPENRVMTSSPLRLELRDQTKKNPQTSTASVYDNGAIFNVPASPTPQDSINQKFDESLQLLRDAISGCDTCSYLHPSTPPRRVLSTPRPPSEPPEPDIEDLNSHLNEILEDVRISTTSLTRAAATSTAPFPNLHLIDDPDYDEVAESSESESISETTSQGDEIDIDDLWPSDHQKRGKVVSRSKSVAVRGSFANIIESTEEVPPLKRPACFPLIPDVEEETEAGSGWMNRFSEKVSEDRSCDHMTPNGHQVDVTSNKLRHVSTSSTASMTSSSATERNGQLTSGMREESIKPQLTLPVSSPLSGNNSLQARNSFKSRIIDSTKILKTPNSVFHNLVKTPKTEVKVSSPVRIRKKTWSRKLTKKLKLMSSQDNPTVGTSTHESKTPGIERPFPHPRDLPSTSPASYQTSLQDIERKFIGKRDSGILNKYHLDISMAHQRRISRQLLLNNVHRDPNIQLVTLSQFKKYKPSPYSSYQAPLIDGCLVITIYGVCDLKKTLCEANCLVQIDDATDKRIGTTMQTCKGQVAWNQCFEMTVNKARLLHLILYTWDTRSGKHKKSSQASINLTTVLQGVTCRDMYSKRLAVRLEPRGTIYIKIALEPGSNNTGPLMFGADLQSIVDRETDTDLPIPRLVHTCIQEVEKRGMQVVGIYRLCGSAIVKRELRQKLEESKTETLLNAENYPDVNVITGILKDFLRELPQPLFPPELLEAVTTLMENNPGPLPVPVVSEAFAPEPCHYLNGGSVNERSDPNETLDRAETLLNHIQLLTTMSHAEKATLYALMNHLKKVAIHNSLNKMNCQNLAVCFGPVLLGPTNTSVGNFSVFTKRSLKRTKSNGEKK